MSTDDDARTVKLVSRDDQEFTLPLAAAKLSVFVRNSLGVDEDHNNNPAAEDADDADDGEVEEGLKVDVIRVSGGCLGKVVEFMKHHNEEAMAEITMPLQGPTFEDVRLFCICWNDSWCDAVFAGGSVNSFAYISCAFLFTVLSILQCMNQEWYRTFVSGIEREMLFELLTAANYMDIKPLLDLACLRVTFELSQKTAEEVSCCRFLFLIRYYRRCFCFSYRKRKIAESTPHATILLIRRRNTKSEIVMTPVADSHVFGSSRIDSRGRGACA